MLRTSRSNMRCPFCKYVAFGLTNAFCMVKYVKVKEI